MLRRSGFKRLPVGVGVLALVALAVVPAASTANPVLVYTAGIAPTTSVAGDSHDYTVTITNDPSSTKKLGSANITIPSGALSTSLGAVSVSGWTATLASGVVQLRAGTNGVAISAGSSVSVHVTTRLTVAGASIWAMAAMQSIDFSTDPFTLSGSDATVQVSPGPLDHFAWTTQPGASQTAGVAFSAAVTAYDAFGNVKTDYSGTSATFTGLSNSPHGDLPTYGFTWGSGTGVATSSTVTDKKAETTQLTVADGSISASSNSFVVAPNVPFRLSFAPADGGKQPTEVAQKSAPENNVLKTKVYDEDTFGNPEVGVNVQLAIGTNPSGGTLSGTTVKATNSSGVAVFDSAENLQIDKPGIGYRLAATSPDVSPTAGPTPSSFFNVANVLKNCNGASCQTQTADQFATVTVTSGTGVTVGTLAVTLGTPPPTTNCQTGSITTAVGDTIEVTPSNVTGSGTFEVVGTLFHRNNAGGIGNVLLCINHGEVDPNTGQPINFFTIPACNKSNGIAPCYNKLSGNGQGDIFFDALISASDPYIDGGGR